MRQVKTLDNRKAKTLYKTSKVKTIDKKEVKTLYKRTVKTN